MKRILYVFIFFFTCDCISELYIIKTTSNKNNMFHLQIIHLSSSLERMRSLIKHLLLTFITINSVSPLFVPILEDIYRQYKNQRFHFREDPFLGNERVMEEYDFVVVGAGPGGAVVTNRLTEEEEWNVLLLEAGKDASIYTDIPAVVSYLQFTDYKWGYKTEKMAGNCLAMEDQKCVWPRGKGMGGTSLINYMLYTRGSRNDYDSIAEQGNTGWSFDDVLPYFLKSENCSIDEYKSSQFHSHSGYLNVDNIPFKSKSISAFLEGASELGYPVGDYNAPGSSSTFSRVQSTQKFGRRVSASTAFLENIKNRRNFHVVEQARVTKVLIDKASMKAIGVEFVKNRKRRIVRARKEVILSAGSLNSPQLLMLSGIGPEDHLKDIGVDVIRNLPVGRNLQDHFTMPGLVFTVNNTDTLTELKTQNIEALAEWWFEGGGILSIPGGVEGIGFVSSSVGSSDIELLFINGGLNSGDTVRKSFGITDEFYNSVFSSIDNLETVSIWPIVLKPQSRGKILLKDKNPFHWPLFYHDYFADTSDLDVLVDGIKQALRFSETKAFKSMNAKLHSVPYPGCVNFTFMSDDYWKCTAKYLTMTLYHQCGTCKMGLKEDPSSVVDHELRVHGISNLRVVDASVFPTVPSAHLYAPTLMVGEKAADMIKSYWLNKNELNTTMF